MHIHGKSLLSWVIREDPSCVLIMDMLIMIFRMLNVNELQPYLTILARYLPTIRTRSSAECMPLW